MTKRIPPKQTDGGDAATDSAVVHIHLAARTYCDFNCDCVVDVANATPEQLQDLADKFYEEIDGSLYEEDRMSWDHEASDATLVSELTSSPTYRATLVADEWQIEEL